MVQFPHCTQYCVEQSPISLQLELLGPARLVQIVLVNTRNIAP